jgi:cob(I)alamin adenosyltransferase
VKIYTRRGDAGETDLLGGARVSKDDVRIESYGAVDELNASLGVCRTATAHKDVRELLERIQGELFDLGAYLASPDAARRARNGIAEPGPEAIEVLEGSIDGFEQELEPLRRFVLPGGTPAAAAFHVARTDCRRAERRAVALDRTDPLDATALRYLNRLSDLLFVLARLENRRAGEPELEWAGRKR